MKEYLLNKTMRIFLSFLLLIAMTSVCFSQTKPKTKPKTKPTPTNIADQQEVITKDGKKVILKNNGTWVYETIPVNLPNKINGKKSPIFQAEIGKEIHFNGMGITLIAIEKTKDNEYPKLKMSFTIRNISHDGALGVTSESQIKEDINGFEHQKEPGALRTYKKTMLKGSLIKGDIQLSLYEYEDLKRQEIIPKRIFSTIYFPDETKPYMGYDGSNQVVLEIGEDLLKPINISKFEVNTSQKMTEMFPNSPKGAIPSNSEGAPNALVTIEEFADFQCPTCGSMHSQIKEIRETYGDRVRIIFREFPLQMHKHGYDAAYAAESAGLQGKFWHMQNQLFSNQSTWASSIDTRKIFIDYAYKLGLDVEKFSNDMVGLIVKNRVDSDMQRGRALNINSSPVFFINNKLYEGDLYLLKTAVDDELRKVESNRQITDKRPLKQDN